MDTGTVDLTDPEDTGEPVSEPEEPVETAEPVSEPSLSDREYEGGIEYEEI